MITKEKILENKRRREAREASFREQEEAESQRQSDELAALALGSFINLAKTIDEYNECLERQPKKKPSKPTKERIPACSVADILGK